MLPGLGRTQHDANGERGLLGLDALERPANVADVGAALGRGNPIPHEPDDDDEAAGMRYVLTQVLHGYTPIGVDEVTVLVLTGTGLKATPRIADLLGIPL